MSLLAFRLPRHAPHQHRYLVAGLVISLVVHGVALLWHWAAAPARPPIPSTLTVSLVNTRSEQAPLTPATLAQHDMHGGGAADHGPQRASPLPRLDDDALSDAMLDALRQREAELLAEQQALLTRLRARDTAAVAPTVAETTEQQDAGTGADTAQTGEVPAAWAVSPNAPPALIDDTTEPIQAGPVQQLDGPSARAALHAAYVEQWRRQIERLGTEHYPPQARGRIYGDLQLTAHIARDGTLLSVEVDRPSPHAVLNLAARRIVEMAAPYPPFPPALADQQDSIRITRTWHFTHDDQLDMQ